MKCFAWSSHPYVALRGKHDITPHLVVFCLFKKPTKMCKEASLIEVQRAHIVVISEKLKCSKAAVHNVVLTFANSGTENGLGVHE